MNRVYEDCYLTIPELAKKANVQAEWLREQARIRKDPLPTTVRSKRPLVLWSNFVEWFENRYGVDGYDRGDAIIDISSLR
jgi:hypothetical protein